MTAGLQPGDWVRLEDDDRLGQVIEVVGVIESEWGTVVSVEWISGTPFSTHRATQLLKVDFRDPTTLENWLRS